MHKFPSDLQAEIKKKILSMVFVERLKLIESTSPAKNAEPPTPYSRKDVSKQCVVSGNQDSNQNVNNTKDVDEIFDTGLDSPIYNLQNDEPLEDSQMADPSVSTKDKKLLANERLSSLQLNTDKGEEELDNPEDKFQHHEKIMHRVEKQFKCKHCSHTCTRMEDLMQHEKTVHCEKRFHCKVCGKSFAHLSNLKKHGKVHTNKTTILSCRMCKFSCEGYTNFKNHVKKHTWDSVFKCNRCDFSCLYSSDFLEHQKVHENEKNFSCNECSYKCDTLHRLKAHTRFHTGEKPYVCTVCNHKSADASSFAIHRRRHTGEKPFACDLCDYKTSQSSMLPRHKRRMHTNKLLFV